MLLPPQPAMTDLSALHWTPPTPSIFFHVNIGKLGLKILDGLFPRKLPYVEYQTSVHYLSYLSVPMPLLYTCVYNPQSSDLRHTGVQNESDDEAALVSFTLAHC